MNQTLQDIKNWTSLNNLKKGKPPGQIATLLILIISALLIFTLITVNIGQISSYATRLSNAADSASLYLASQIGTKSYQLSASLQRSCGSPVQCCRKTGLLSIVLAIVVAIAAIVLAPALAPTLVGATSVAAMSTTAMVVTGAIGGAVGGAIGGAIAGTGALQGAIQGAMVGAAIGGGIGQGLDWAYANIERLATFGSSAAIGGASLAAASNIYNAYIEDIRSGAAMAAAAKALSGLPEYQRIRESVFLQALSQTVDDPNKVADILDSDGDGDIAELVPNFQACWDERITWLKDNNGTNIGAARDAVNNFLNGPVATFQGAINNFRLHLIREDSDPPMMECTSGSGDDISTYLCSKDGDMVEILRTLNDNGYTSFWKPGPTLAELDAWRNSWDPGACPTCEPPDPPIDKGYDELDYVIDELGGFGADINDLSSQNRDNLVYNWRYWVPWFYDTGTDEFQPGSSPGDYYHTLYNLINGDSSSDPARLGLKGWIDEIERLRSILPACQFGYYEVLDYGGDGDGGGDGEGDGYAEGGGGGGEGGGGDPCVGSGGGSGECVVNPPCQGDISNPPFGTANEDVVDEFQNAKQAINDFIPAIEAFRQACAAIYNTMLSLMEPIEQNIPPMACGLTGINPAAYNWQDSRGNHSISVGVGNFQMPYLRSRRSGNWLKGKTCIELIYHTQNVTVWIDRHDPAQVQTGVLGKWNPSGGGIIRRKSTAQYKGLTSGGYVNIVGR